MRSGGVSAGPYATLNLGGHVGDDPVAVVENRRRAAGLVGASAVVWLRHVHGSRILDADGDATRPEAIKNRESLGAGLPGTPEADGAVTVRPGVALAAIGADCAPVAIANDTACAAVHCGWRGLVAGVVGAGVRSVRARGSGPVCVAVGPCVCGRCYGFGADDLTAVALAVGPEVVACTSDGDPALDLRAGIHAVLRDEGVTDVVDIVMCTVESADLFSFRREGITGRHGVIVSLDSPGRRGQPAL